MDTIWDRSPSKSEAVVTVMKKLNDHNAELTKVELQKIDILWTPAVNLLTLWYRLAWFIVLLVLPPFLHLRSIIYDQILLPRFRHSTGRLHHPDIYQTPHEHIWLILWYWLSSVVFLSAWPVLKGTSTQYRSWAKLCEFGPSGIVSLFHRE